MLQSRGLSPRTSVGSTSSFFIVSSHIKAHAAGQMEPLTFAPLYMERVWGGRTLETAYNRELPKSEAPYGESWEIVDREQEQSFVQAGIHAGKSMHQLWMDHREEVFGLGFPDHPRFPLLIKVLDARDDLSIQVHPPAGLATTLGGEPKTEMWYIADCNPAAKLFVGLKLGTSRADFEKSIADGTVADLVHAITPQCGESIFIASGRLHAIGAGFLIHEIQQNSDTTYRVFDWNRLGLDGKARELHIAESLASIDFRDFAPTMDIPCRNTLAECEFFKTDKISLEPGQIISNPTKERFSILSIIEGTLMSDNGHHFHKGQFMLIPRNGSPLTATENAIVLQVTIPV